MCSPVCAQMWIFGFTNYQILQHWTILFQNKICNKWPRKKGYALCHVIKKESQFKNIKLSILFLLQLWELHQSKIEAQAIKHHYSCWHTNKSEDNINEKKDINRYWVFIIITLKMDLWYFIQSFPFSWAKRTFSFWNALSLSGSIINWKTNRKHSILSFFLSLNYVFSATKQMNQQ